ncbi:hypothetical protein H0H93_009959 [Arthromyces matolae]|nr:hypothetical protein H0H93_009959 [Arthromyces matolae]
MAPMALAAPRITAGTDVKKRRHSGAFPLRSKTGSADHSKSRHASQSTPLLNPTTILEKYIQGLLEFENFRKANLDGKNSAGTSPEEKKSLAKRNNRAKHNLDNDLKLFAAALKATNNLGVSYRRDVIYKAVKDLLNEVLINWEGYWLKPYVSQSLVECLVQTTPLTGFGELPLESELKEWSRRMIQNDQTWKDLQFFLNTFEWVLEQAKERALPYNILAVEEELKKLKSAVQTWGTHKAVTAVQDDINECQALNLSKVSPPPPAPSNFHPSVPLSCPSMSHSSPSSTSTLLCYDQHPAPEEQSSAERLVMALVTSTSQDHISQLPRAMEQVPDDVCARRLQDWNFSISLMLSCLSTRVGTEQRVLENLDLALRILRSKADNVDGSVSKALSDNLTSISR